MALANEIPAWSVALKTLRYLYGSEFDGAAQRTREYVLTYPTEYGKGMTFSQLLFARRRRTIEKEIHLLEAMRPESPRRTEEELIQLFGYAPEKLQATRRAK